MKAKFLKTYENNRKIYRVFDGYCGTYCCLLA